VSRVRQIDGLRGFALLGIVLGNVLWFSGYAVDPAPSKDVFGLDAVVTFAQHLFIDGKFYALFSLLFGASFGLMMQRRAWLARPRLTSLMVLGALHAGFLWFGDILSLYAVAALPLPRLLRCSDRVLWRWALALLAGPALLSIALLPLADQLDPGTLLYGPSAQLTAFGGDDWAALWHANAAFLRQRWVLALTSGRLLRLLGLFVLGALLVRRRPTLTARGRALLVVVALASNLAYAGLADVPVLPPSIRGVLRDAVACVALPSGALAYAAHLWAPLRDPGRVQDALVHAGRLSLTHYLSQSLLLAALFYGVGAGLWGRLGATTSVAIALVLAGMQVALSGPLRRRFGHGPGERALRWLDMLSERRRLWPRA